MMTNILGNIKSSIGVTVKLSRPVLFTRVEYIKLLNELSLIIISKYGICLSLNTPDEIIIDLPIERVK